MQVRVSKSDFESLYGEHLGRVRRFVGEFVRDPGIADELTQDTFLKALGALESYRGEASVRTWLFRIARNVCLDYVRSPRSSRASSLDVLEGERGDGAGYAFTIAGREAPRSVEEVARQAEMSECVQAFVGDLQETLRTPLILHDVEEMTNTEIATVLGCSLEAVKMRLHRARVRLREMMEERCDLFHDERNVLACAPASAALAGDCEPDCPPGDEACR